MSPRQSVQSWLPERSVSPYQAYALTFGTIIGSGILIFPRLMAREAGTDGILVIPLVGVISGIMIYVITKLCGLFPGMSLVGIIREVLGTGRSPWLGKVLSFPFLVFFVAYWVVIMAVVTRTFGQVLVTGIYQRTPIVVIMLMLVAAAYVSYSRADVLARFNEFLLPLIYAPGILLIAALIQAGEVKHLLPLFQADWKQVVKGFSTALFSYTGFEVALIFMGAYQQPKKALRPHLTAMFVITIPIYWFTYLVCLAVFGKEELIRLAWPLLELVKTVHIPGMILERLESAVLAIWVMMAVFTTLTNILFAIVHTLHESFGLAGRRRKWLTLLAGGVIYGLALWPTNIYELSKWGEWIGYFWLLTALFIPLLMYIIARIRGKGGKKQDESPSV